MNDFFQGKIVFHFGKHEKSYEFNFCPKELCFQKVLIPIFLTDLNIPTSELKFLTKEARSLILKIKNMEMDMIKFSSKDLTKEFEMHGHQVTKIEAFGVGSLVALLLPIKNLKVTCVDYPYNLLPSDIKRKIYKKEKIDFHYTEEFILKPFASLCPQKSNKRKAKRKVAA